MMQKAHPHTVTLAHKHQHQQIPPGCINKEQLYDMMRDLHGTAEDLEVQLKESSEEVSYKCLYGMLIVIGCSIYRAC
jgi:hypothetical protein